MWYNSFSASEGAWKRGSKASPILLYANSSDGINWSKPSLGLVKGISNGVFAGEGVGVYQDRLDSPERRFKAFGLFCADPQNTSCALCHKDPTLCPPQQNIAVSADGLTWTNATNTSWRFPVGHGVGDCHDNLFFDQRTHRWLATTRVTQDFSSAQVDLRGKVICAYTHTQSPAADYCCGQSDVHGVNMCSAGRLIGIMSSPGEDFAFNAATPPVTTLIGSPAHQLYSQVTFPWCVADSFA